ncbi:uncharacterized protein LOC117880927 [Trachemys scripta elegans]|uniref:uncharacterized protein LOC117880927 n=1 Tax=Trachemys scripta elegans TaxID=31138 RepID=UPI0015553B20|nr:uncharacterized protein LOC117880927 [Trachemys scripta elegans]
MSSVLLSPACGHIAVHSPEPILPPPPPCTPTPGGSQVVTLPPLTMVTDAQGHFKQIGTNTPASGMTDPNSATLSGRVNVPNICALATLSLTMRRHSPPRAGRGPRSPVSCIPTLSSKWSSVHPFPLEWLVPIGKPVALAEVCARSPTGQSSTLLAATAAMVPSLFSAVNGRAPCNMLQVPPIQSRVPWWQVRDELIEPWPAALLPAEPLVGLGSRCSGKLLWYQPACLPVSSGHRLREKLGSSDRGADWGSAHGRGGNCPQFHLGVKRAGNRQIHVGIQIGWKPAPELQALLWLQLAAWGPFPAQPGELIQSQSLQLFHRGWGGKSALPNIWEAPPWRGADPPALHRPGEGAPCFPPTRLTLSCPSNSLASPHAVGCAAWHWHRCTSSGP